MAKKILLADDSITIQKVVELTFSDGDYEVVATNNGARAIEKLADYRPDLILSDIIMPEKNGYEVCEYVKSHPELRHIPVILLTGTFEPFDPDRAEKAGCDAVVTKPFESQSLIQKVEELIHRSAAPASPSPESEAFAPEESEPSAPLEETTPFGAAEPAAESSPFDEPAAASPFEESPVQPPQFQPPEPSPEPEVFGEDQQPEGETKLIPKMSFDDLQQMQDPPPGPQVEDRGSFSPSSEEATPFSDSEEPPAFDEPEGGETKLIPKMTFDDLQRMEQESAPPESAVDDGPWVSEPEPEPEQAATPEPQPEPEPEEPQEGGETRLIPKMSFDDLQQMQDTEQSVPSGEAEPEAAWQSPFGGEGQETAEDAPPEEPAFQESEAVDAGPFGEPAPSAPEPQEPALFQQQPSPDFGGPEAPETSEAPAFELDSPAETGEPEGWPSPAGEETSEPLAAAEDEGAPSESAPEAAAEAEPPAAAAGPISDDQVEQIARRVAELISDKVIREIAWEILPDIAEMAVKERIRELENED